TPAAASSSSSADGGGDPTALLGPFVDGSVGVGDDSAVVPSAVDGSSDCAVGEGEVSSPPPPRTYGPSRTPARTPITTTPISTSLRDMRPSSHRRVPTMDEAGPPGPGTTAGLRPAPAATEGTGVEITIGVRDIARELTLE